MSVADSEPMLEPVSLNKVKLIRNTKGVNWEITVVEGATDTLLDDLRRIAVAQHNALAAEFPE